MENTNNPEINKREEFIIEAPEFLAFHQHVMDQEPFASVVTNIQEQTGIKDDDYLAYIRNALKWGIGLPSLSSITHSEGEKKKPFWYSDFLFRIKSYARTKNIDKNLLHPELILEEASKLSEFPEIRTYVTDYEFTHRYDNEQGYNAVPTPSYAKWASDKIMREKRLISAEIRSLIFGETDSLQTKIQGHKPGWKHWAIRKATEIKK